MSNILLPFHRPYLLFFLFAAFLWAGQQSGQDGLKQTYQAGQAALASGDLPTAEQSFKKVLDLAPNDVGANVNLGVVFMREKNWSGALKYLQQAEKLAPKVTGIRLNIALVDYQTGDYAAAIPVFESVLHDQPQSIQAQRLLGLCYLFQEQYEKAMAALEPLWAASNTDLSYLYSLAVAAGNSGQPEKMNKALDQMLRVEGADSPLVHLLLAKTYLARGDYEQAETQLEAAQKGDFRLPMLHYTLGMVYRRMSQPEKAEAEFKQDAEIEPNVPYNDEQLGLLAALKNQPEAAEAFFLKAVAGDPKLGTAWFGLAKIYRRQQRYRDSLKALDRAAKIDPKSASLHYLRAQVLESLGDKAAARIEFQTVQQLKRENVDKLEQQVSGSYYHDPEIAH